MPSFIYSYRVSMSQLLLIWIFMIASPNPVSPPYGKSLARIFEIPRSYLFAWIMFWLRFVRLFFIKSEIGKICLFVMRWEGNKAFHQFPFPKWILISCQKAVTSSCETNKIVKDLWHLTGLAICTVNIFLWNLVVLSSFPSSLFVISVQHKKTGSPLGQGTRRGRGRSGFKYQLWYRPESIHWGPESTTLP